MSDRYPRIIDEHKCETCQHFSLKVAFVGTEPGEGKCFGWKDVDAEPPSEDDPYGYTPPRWVKETDTCERYRFYPAMGELKAEQRLRAELWAQRQIEGLGKTFDQMLELLEAAPK